MTTPCWGGRHGLVKRRFLVSRQYYQTSTADLSSIANLTVKILILCLAKSSVNLQTRLAAEIRSHFRTRFRNSQASPSLTAICCLVIRWPITDHSQQKHSSALSQTKGCRRLAYLLALYKRRYDTFYQKQLLDILRAEFISLNDGQPFGSNCRYLSLQTQQRLLIGPCSANQGHSGQACGPACRVLSSASPAPLAS